MELKNLKRISGSSLKYVFTVCIPEWGNIEIDCAYFEKDNGSSWINFAAKEYTDKEGKRKSHNQVRWPQSVAEKLTKAIQQKLTTQQEKKEIQDEIPF